MVGADWKSKEVRCRGQAAYTIAMCRSTISYPIGSHNFFLSSTGCHNSVVLREGSYHGDVYLA